MSFVDVIILAGVVTFFVVTAKFKFFAKHKCKVCKCRKSCKNVK